MSRSTCIPLYPATDGQQTGNNFVDGNKQHVDGNMLPWCKRGLKPLQKSCNCYSRPPPVTVVTGTPKYDRRLIFCATVFIASVCRGKSRTLSPSFSSRYMDECTPVAYVAACSPLLSARRYLIIVHTLQHVCVWPVAGPSLLLARRPGTPSQKPSFFIGSFRRQLRTFLFSD